MHKGARKENTAVPSHNGIPANRTLLAFDEKYFRILKHSTTASFQIITYSTQYSKLYNPAFQIMGSALANIRFYMIYLSTFSKTWDSAS
jgi:hypothetical protein